MAQINFRVDNEVGSIIKLVSEIKGISAAELAKQATLKEIASIRVDIAFDLLKKGKITRKKAWKISGLSSHEFLHEWTERGAEEKISEKVLDKEIALIKEIDLSKYRKYLQHT